MSTDTLEDYYLPSERIYSSDWTDVVQTSPRAGARRAAHQSIVDAAHPLSRVLEEAPLAETIPSVWQRVLALIPPFISARTPLRWAILPVLAFAFILPSLTANVITYAFLSVAVPPSPWIEAFSHNFLDPTLFHIAVGFIITGLLAYIGRKSGASWWQSIVPAVMTITLAMVFQYLLDSFVMKPAIGVPRPEEYQLGSDPFIVRFAHTIFGSGNDFPSGAVARQVILACLLTWVCSHPLLTLGRSITFTLCGIGWAMVFPVALLRIYVRAHSVEGVLVGVSSGIMEFWIVVVVLGSLFSKQARNLLPDLMQLWILLMTGWLVLAAHRLIVGFVVISIAIVIPLWDHFAEWASRQIDRAIIRDTARRTHRTAIDIHETKARAA